MVARLMIASVSDILYLWLIPAVILSAIAGKFPSEYTSYYILDRLRQRLDLRWEIEHLEPRPGGTYSWRPVRRSSGSGQWRTVGYLIISFLYVGSAFGISFFISWKTPSEGMGCRGVVELSHMVAWVASFLFTCLVRSVKWRALHRSWSIVFVKDTLLAVPVIAVLLGAFAGKFIFFFFHLPISLQTHPGVTKTQ
jgi:hypothetical protein